MNYLSFSLEQSDQWFKWLFFFLQFGQKIKQNYSWSDRFMHNLKIHIYILLSGNMNRNLGESIKSYRKKQSCIRVQSLTSTAQFKSRLAGQVTKCLGYHLSRQGSVIQIKIRAV